MNTLQIQESIIFAIKKLKKDYKNNFLCHEGSLQSALYMHLRNRLKFGANEKIWCELRLKTEEFKEEETIIEQVAVDMAIVNINDQEYHLKNRISNVLALIEIKYVQMSEKAKREFTENISKNKEGGAKIAQLLHNDIIKLNKLRGSCMNMNGDNLLIKHHIPSTYFIACIEDSKTYKEEFFVIENGETFLPIPPKPSSKN